MKEKLEILVVDDDVKFLDVLTIYLTQCGYEVSAAVDGRAAWQMFFRKAPALIVLDIMMPGMDGWELCSRVREVSDVPVIILTARGQEYDKIKGLKMGADDYLVKPFSLRELEARIEAVLRRAHRSPDEGKDIFYSDGTLTVDARRWEVLRGETPVDLTSTERRLLFFLVEHAGRILPTERILEAVWGPEYTDQTDYVKLYIWRLRQKIEPVPEQPTYLLTERGIGYRFAGQQQP